MYLIVELPIHFEFNNNEGIKVLNENNTNTFKYLDFILSTSFHLHYILNYFPKIDILMTIFVLIIFQVGLT